MTASSVVQSMLPTWLALFVGFALARWLSGGPEALRAVLRYALFPAVVFVVLVPGVPAQSLLQLLAVGAAMGAAGHLLVRFVPRTGLAVDPSAALPNLAVFTLGREVKEDHSCALQEVKDAFSKTGKFRDFYKALITSPAFIKRDVQ